MSSHEAHWPRVAAVVFGLLAFALGSNHCLIGASRGEAGMACTAMPPAGQPARDCCHGPSTGAAEPTPESSTHSCCIEPAPLPTPLSLAALPDVSPATLAVVPQVAAPAAPVEGDPPLGAVADHPPPNLALPTPLASRAPPLA